MSRLTDLLAKAREDNPDYYGASRYDLLDVLEANAEAIQALWEAADKVWKHPRSVEANQDLLLAVEALRSLCGDE